MEPWREQRRLIVRFWIEDGELLTRERITLQFAGSVGLYIVEGHAAASGSHSGFPRYAIFSVAVDFPGISALVVRGYDLGA
jgi:hypothetical protein